MKLVPMRFKGVSWRHNPRQISFECDKTVTELKAPFASSVVQDMGRKNMLIRGEGELFGDDCIEQFEQLLNLFRQGGEGLLSFAKMTPIYAVFESLKIIGTPRPDSLTYSFVFREVMQKKKTEKSLGCSAQNGECLWDIAYRYSESIDRLLSLNPWVKRPDSPLEGRYIRLC